MNHYITNNICTFKQKLTLREKLKITFLENKADLKIFTTVGFAKHFYIFNRV